MQYEFISSIFYDIINGYSKYKIDNTYLFIKHIDLNTELLSSKKYLQKVEDYKSIGLPTEKERLDFLKEEGLWLDDDEKFITSNKTYLKNLEKAKSNLVIKSQIDQLEKAKKDIEEKLIEKITIKENLIGATCEKYAEQNKEEFQIFSLLFKSSDLKENFLSTEDFEYCNISYLKKLTGIYYEHFKEFSDENIKKICCSPIFFNYYSIINRESSYEFFGKKLTELTFFQQKLLNYAKNLKFILENADVPDDIRNNYDDILDFWKRKNQQSTSSEKGNKSNSAYSMVGANKSEMNKAGINTDGTISPFDLLKKSGKNTLSKKDMLNAMNPV